MNHRRLSTVYLLVSASHITSTRPAVCYEWIIKAGECFHWHPSLFVPFILQAAALTQQRFCFLPKPAKVKLYSEWIAEFLNGIQTTHAAVYG